MSAKSPNLVAWGTPVIPALRRQMQEDFKFKASCGYVEIFCFKKKKQLGKTHSHTSLCT
jgi:hypothetical protein